MKKEVIDTKKLLQMQFERDFMKKPNDDKALLNERLKMKPLFNKISEYVREEKTFDSRFWNMDFLSKEYGINLEIKGNDQPLLDAFQNNFHQKCYDKKRTYLWYQSPNETTTDFGRLNADLVQIQMLEQVFVTAMTLILNVHNGIDCPLTAEDESAMNLDIGYWYNNIDGVLIPQNIGIENLRPIYGQRISFHLHTEPARYYKPLRNLLVEK